MADTSFKRLLLLASLSVAPLLITACGSMRNNTEIADRPYRPLSNSTAAAAAAAPTAVAPAPAAVTPLAAAAPAAALPTPADRSTTGANTLATTSAPMTTQAAVQSSGIKPISSTAAPVTQIRVSPTGIPYKISENPSRAEQIDGPAIPKGIPVEGDPTRVYNPYNPKQRVRIIDSKTGQPYPSGKVLGIPGTQLRFMVP